MSVVRSYDMETIDMPIFSNTLKLMKFWSYLFVHNWRRYMALIPYTLINFTQYLDIYWNTQPMYFIIRDIYMAVLFTDTILRGVLLCVQRKRYEQFLELLKGYYIELLQTDDPYIQNLINATEMLAGFIARINLIMGTCTCIGVVLYPLFATDKVLPIAMIVPGLDKYTSPYYEIFFVIQAIMTPAGCCMYIPYTNLVVAFTLFAILMYKVLQHKLRMLKTLNKAEARKQIIWCIKYQLKAISFVDGINDLATYIYLIEFISFGAMLCVLLFSLIVTRTLAQKFIMIAYIVMTLANSFVLYYVANELYFHSCNVATAAYESNWMDFDIDTQKALQLLILRSQKPCAILVGGVYPMNLQMLQSLLNFIYSFFTLLRRMYG